MSDGFSLAGRVAVVTGGSRGIGRAIAKGLVDHGAHVLIASRSADSCAQAAAEVGEGAEAHACDVTDAADIAKLFARTEALGGCDVLVCAAGLATASSAASTSREEFDQMLDVHLHGGVATAQAAHAQMKAKGRGAVLMVTSVWGLGGHPGSLAYGSAKAALAHAVKVMAVEWARHGIRVNGLAPGFVETDMTAVIESGARDTLIKRVPMRRPGQPDEMVGPALLLVSDAGSYITGQTLVADGGERSRC